MRRIDRLARRNFPRLGLLLFLSGCGSAETAAPPPVERETPSAQIFRVGRTWEARIQEKGFRSAPSPISVFDVQLTSKLVFEEGQSVATEKLDVSERFEMRDGRAYACTAKTSLQVAVRFGYRREEPAVEIQRPPSALPRTCQPADFPEPEVDLPSGSARFVLRGDQLVAFAPTLEKRVYLPVQ
jgi:hypothetical protein